MQLTSQQKHRIVVARGGAGVSDVAGDVLGKVREAV